ncbi:chromo domain-containing protein [Colletotrichum kahawae]|uniref:Chromo domain-containing protein n=1 Tax=Colletotrichum kahawae TaxID=34407 RepID=A0AAD9YE86_COLKA|nr:chromo domain-containing protein [Colletotrichum kahawae]
MQPAVSPPAFVAPVADMHCLTSEATGYPPSRDSASFQGDILPVITDATPSPPAAKLASQATCEHAPDIITITDACESKVGVKIDCILAHQHDLDDNTRFHMHVRWEGGIKSWEPEIYLHKNHAPTLFAYWESVEGGREGVMEDPGLWHVFRIISHKTGPNGNITHFCVAWVGSPECSWEEEATIRDADSNLVKDYRESQDSCGKTAKKSVRSKNFLRGKTQARDSKSKMEQLRLEQGRCRVTNKGRKWRTQH